MFSSVGKLRPATKLDSKMMFRNKRIIENFVQTADVPKWYRGLSSFQLEAANKLHFDMRDDIEQGTTHRVEALLNRIGLRPTLRKENIRFVMFLSGGNDLAFLWFVKELFYNTDGPDYNVNEQLILSSIARLDMLFTLRGLDRILPPEQPTKYELRRRELEKQKLARKRVHNKASAAETQTVSSMRVKYKLPYFDELVRPRLYEHQLTAYPPPYRTKLLYNDVLRDSNYVIPNAHNRWFADYNLHPGKKTGIQMLTEKMSEMFQTPRRTVLELTSMFDKDMYKRASASLNELINSEHDMQKSLCMHHQALANMEKTIEQEMRVRAREKCLKYFDAETPKREERIERIRRQIEKDVNAHLKQFKKLTERTRSHLQIWSQDEMRPCDTSAHNIDCRLSGGAQTQSDSDIYHRFVKCSSPYKLWRSKSDEILCRTSELMINDAQDYIGDCWMIDMQQRGQQGQCCKACFGRIPPPQVPKYQHDQISKIQRVREILHRMPCDCGYGYIKKFDYGHSENSRSDPEPYFRSPTEHSPYIFDYPRVFAAVKEREENRLTVQREYLKMINSDLNLEKSDPNAPKNLDEAIKRYAKRAFQEGLAAESATDSSDPDNPHRQRHYSFLDIELDYYDPDDSQLMQRMLKNGLDELAKDPRYVLASMPDAHKLPSLLTWISTRYGKVYTRRELRLIHEESLPTVHALKQMTVNVMLPSSKLLGDAISVNYNCRNYLMNKTKMLRKEYYDRVNASIMDQSRTFYMAIKPNLTDNIKDTFFAYMPSREADIQHFRIWRSHEYMPAKEEFIKRQCRALPLSGN